MIVMLVHIHAPGSVYVDWLGMHTTAHYGTTINVDIRTVLFSIYPHFKRSIVEGSTMIKKSIAVTELHITSLILRPNKFTKIDN